MWSAVLAKAASDFLDVEAATAAEPCERQKVQLYRNRLVWLGDALEEEYWYSYLACRTVALGPQVHT